MVLARDCFFLQFLAQWIDVTDVEPPTGPALRHESRLERRKAATRQRIVDAASELFWTKGYDATSIHEIAERADIAAGTLYLHFSGKADVAVVQFQGWMLDFVATLEARPLEEMPDEMLAAALQTLGDQGYTSGQRLRDDAGRPVPSVVMGVLFTEDSQGIAGRVYQVVIEAEQALSALFGRRLGYPPGSIEPQIIASAFIAAWRVAVYGFANMVAAGADPPAPDDIGLQCFTAYAKGLERLWTKKGPAAPTP
jgi:AcrR family transcriptional regulator